METIAFAISSAGSEDELLTSSEVKLMETII